MGKYVVKNCTSLDTDGKTCQDCHYENMGNDYCSNRTNCLIKQVIEKLAPKALIGGLDETIDEVFEMFEIEEEEWK